MPYQCEDRERSRDVVFEKVKTPAARDARSCIAVIHQLSRLIDWSCLRRESGSGGKRAHGPTKESVIQPPTRTLHHLRTCDLLHDIHLYKPTHSFARPCRYLADIAPNNLIISTNVSLRFTNTNEPTNTPDPLDATFAFSEITTIV